ncbi:rod shape-determining protein RodA [Tissierellia bacterium S5-A11]|nr:rod shape-determining protein RodA [Tissierellia bacterium S5-A11]
MENKKGRFLLFPGHKIDYLLLATILGLCIFGLVVLSSATLNIDPVSYVRKQALASVLGFVCLFILMRIDFRIFKKYYLLIYILGNILLLATLVFGHGDTSWGSRSWLKLGPINFQPAEFIKLGLVYSLSVFLEKKDDINQPLQLISVLAFAMVPIGLILLQPDFGTAMVFIFIIASMLFFANVSWKYILGALLAGILILPISYPFLDDFQKDRILNFLNPSANTQGSGYQANEAQIAIGSGKFTGKGLYQGSQTQYNFIPTKQTDSIFPVLVEELGFIGGAGLLILYAIMLYRLMDIARTSRDLCGRYLTIGYTAMFFIHIWENVGMNMGLMPITGIPLPFLSYGGTFQLVNLIALGLVLSVHYHKREAH